MLQCPHGSTGFAKWHCEIGPPQPRWNEQGPTFSECRSLWLADLDSKLREGVSTQNVSSILAEKSDSKIFFGGDLPLAARMLKYMSERMHYDIQVLPNCCILLSINYYKKPSIYFLFNVKFLCYNRIYKPEGPSLV